MSNLLETLPDPDTSTDKELADWYRKNAESLFHILTNVEYGEENDDTN